jgi:hypothetical protein
MNLSCSSSGLGNIYDDDDSDDDDAMTTTTINIWIPRSISYTGTRIL